jgi:hypothetical protein
MGYEIQPRWGSAGRWTKQARASSSETARFDGSTELVTAPRRLPVTVVISENHG